MTSANALSRWRINGLGLRDWDGFDSRRLSLVRDQRVALDSAGFVAAAATVASRGPRRTTSTWRQQRPGSGGLRKIGASSHRSPARRIVLDRISGTVRLNMVCLGGGDRRGIADRFVPVLQGWHPHHYLRCLERMPWVLDYPTCRHRQHVSSARPWRTRHPACPRDARPRLQRVDRPMSPLRPKVASYRLRGPAPARRQHGQPSVRRGRPTSPAAGRWPAQSAAT